MCNCGKPSMYKNECRDCYEDRQRREVRDKNYQSMDSVIERMYEKERCNYSKQKVN